MKIEFRYGGMVFTVESEGAATVTATPENGGGEVAVATGAAAVSALDEAPGLVYEAEMGLLARLISLRRQIAAEEGVPTYVVFQDKTLKEMEEKRPVDMAAFSEIKGVGRVRLEKYGGRFIAAINDGGR